VFLEDSKIRKRTKENYIVVAMGALMVFLLLLVLSHVLGNAYSSLGGVPLSSSPAPAGFHFQQVDALPREEICQYAQEVLQKVVDTNDGLIDAGIAQITSRCAPFVTEEDDGLPLETVLVGLTSRALTMRNLTLLMALVYLDRVAKVLKIYVSSKTLRKLLSSCILVASKLHSNEVSREVLTEVLGLQPQELLDAETCIVESVKDLSIHPQVFLSYCRPLMAMHLGTQHQSPVLHHQQQVVQATTHPSVPPPPPPL